MNVLPVDSTTARVSFPRGGFFPASRLRLMAAAGFFSVASLFWSAPAQADTVIGWDLTGVPTTGVPARAPTSLEENLTAIDLTRGPGIALSNLNSGFSSNRWSWDPEVPTADLDPEEHFYEPTRENALLNGEYYQFGFTVDSGYRVALTTLEVSLRRSGIPAPMHFEWQYSFDGFATPGVTIPPAGPVWDTLGWTDDFFLYLGRASGSGGVAQDYNYMISDVSGQDAGNAMPPIVLTDIPALQNIPEGTTVTFRLYAWSGLNGAEPTASNSVAIGRNHGPVLTGTVAPVGQMPLTVISVAPGTAPPAGLHIFPEGSEVTASAPLEVVEEGVVRHTLTGWSGSGSLPASQGVENSLTFNLNTPTILEWHWQTEHRLAARLEGNGTLTVRKTDPLQLIGFDFAGWTHREDGPLPGEQHNDQGVPASNVDPLLAPSTITRGPGLTPVNLSVGGISSSNWHLTPDLAAAIAGGKYYEFNVTPTGGAAVDVHSIYMPYRYTQTGPHTIALLYSLDQFATYTVAEILVIQDQASGTQTSNYTFVLPADPQLQDVSNELLFRVYGWGGTGGGTGTFAIYNEKGSGYEDLVIMGGTSATITVSADEDLWFDPASLIQVEATANPGSVFTGWSGPAFSNSPILRGFDMGEPLVFNATFATDSDGDGIPDWWKLHFFGTLAVGANDDPDGDGLSNLEEYLRGTDPTVAEELVATDNLVPSFWENPQRDPLLAGQFLIRDFGNGFRGAWEASGDRRGALMPFHPDGEPVAAVSNISFDGPRMIVREEAWDDSWNQPTISAVFSVGDVGGTSLYFNYHDELNWYRVTVSGGEHGPSGPRIGVSVDSRINGQYTQEAYQMQPSSDPTDASGFKRVRIIAESHGWGYEIHVAGWNESMSPAGWDTATQLWHFDTTLPEGRAGLGAWAQGPSTHTPPAWNPVDSGVLFETFTVVAGGVTVFHEDWSSASVAGLPDDWEDPFASISALAGDWTTSAHGSFVQLSANGQNTSGTAASPRADADGPILLGPPAAVSSYLLELGIHAFDTGAAGFVFDFKDTDNYGRVLFARTTGTAAGSIPSGVVVSRKSNGAWTDVFIEDTSFVYRPGQPFLVTFSRSGSRYVMTAREADHPDSLRRWEWDDSSAAPGPGRYGVTSWKSADVHYLYSDLYGVAVVDAGELTVTAIARDGANIVLTIENDSGAPYQVQRTLDLTSGDWETVATDQTGTSWTGPIPSGADRAFWRLVR